MIALDRNNLYHNNFAHGDSVTVEVIPLKAGPNVR